MPLFDTHCHLDFAEFDNDRIDVFNCAQARGVEKILLPGVRAEQWANLMGLARQHPQQLCFALGLHPFWCDSHQTAHLIQLEKVLQQKPDGLVAIGECGLDAVAAPARMKKQQALLEAQLELALKFELPVILHIRKAHPQLQQLLKRFTGIRGVIHGFSGSYELAKSYLDLGMLLGIGGTITYPRANKTRAALSRLPLNSLVLETDAPDMPLCGYQGQRNEPARLQQVLEALAELRDEPKQEIERQLWRNSLALFLSSD